MAQAFIAAVLFSAAPALHAADPAGDGYGGRPEEGEQPAPGEGEQPASGEEKADSGAAAPGSAGPAPPTVVTRTEYVYLKEKAKKKSLLLLEPKALSVRFLFERFRVGSDTLRGSSIEPDEDLGMDSVVFLKPDVNWELEFKIFGLRARLGFSYTDNTMHGLRTLDRAFSFSRTTFPSGTVLGASFTQRRATARYFQEIAASDLIDVDLALGADYVFFRNVLDAPALAREKDATEHALPILGCRAFYKPYEWAWVFVRIDGFYWNLGRETGEAGILEAAAGLSFRLSENLGFEVEFSVDVISIRKGRKARVELDYVEFGPGIAVYAKL